MLETEVVKLIVGLGNPGPRYDQTRHNAGFWFVDELAARFQARLQSDRRFSGMISRLNIADIGIWLLKPETFMNRSAQSIGAMTHYYKIPLTQVLVVHDEIDLPPGAAKLKRAGGHGGHNGLRDIITKLGEDFWRLRLGVGHPGHRDQVTDYVLSPPCKDEHSLICSAIDKAVGLMSLVVEGDMEKAMHVLHTKSDNHEGQVE